MNQTPSPEPSSRFAATCSDVRVLPTPPEPVSVTSRCSFDQRGDLGNLRLAADERGSGIRGKLLAKCRANVAAETRQVGCKQLIDAFGALEILQAMLAEVAQARRAAGDRLGPDRSLRAETSTWPPCPIASSRATRLTGWPEVVAVAFVRRSGMNRSAHAKSVDGREVFGRKRALRASVADCLFGTPERRAERIADRLEDVAAVIDDCRSHQCVSCRRTASCIAARSRSQRCVLPSMSVKTKVTVPLGAGAAETEAGPGFALTPHPSSRSLSEPSVAQSWTAFGPFVELPGTDASVVRRVRLTNATS
jgi:hypothetical protein